MTGPREPHVVGWDHVQIMIPEGGEDEARRFYGEVLGLTEVAKPAPLAARGGAWFVGPGGLAIHLGTPHPTDPHPSVPSGRAHTALLVEGLDALRARLEAAYPHCTSDDDRPIGVRRFYARDPFGNRVEFDDRRDGGFTSAAMPQRQVFVHQATVDLTAGSDEAAVGAAITAELCGHWEHAGACVYPHNTRITERDGTRVTIRTVFGATVADEPTVRSGIQAALRHGALIANGATSHWRLEQEQPDSIRSEERDLAGRLG